MKPQKRKEKPDGIEYMLVTQGRFLPDDHLICVLTLEVIFQITQTVLLNSLDCYNILYIMIHLLDLL